MDAIKYLKEKARMTEKCNILCSDCELFGEHLGRTFDCTVLEKDYPEKAVEIVEKWSKEHPQKTYLSDFLEKYPKAKIDAYEDAPCCCVEELGYIEKCTIGNCKECWNILMEDENE